MALKAKIDGYSVDLSGMRESGWDCLYMIEDERLEWYVAESSEDAGKAAAQYWRDMAEDDAKEFTCIIGEDRLVQWALGRSDSFGIRSLEEFLEKVAEYPEEEWGQYDGTECDIDYDASEYLDDARDALERDGKPLDEDAVKELAEKMLYEAQDEFQSEWGFVPQVAYRAN